MGRTRTLADLVADVRRTVDAEGQDDVLGRHSRDALVRAVNQGAQRLRHLLTERGDFALVVTGTATLTAGVESVTLSDYDGAPNSAIARVLGVLASNTDGAGTSDSRYWRLRRISGGVEYDRYRSLDVQGPPERWFPVVAGATPGQWSIVVAPLPDKEYALRFDYIPAWSDMVADGDTIDGIAGFEDYVVYDAAVRVCERDAGHDGRLGIMLAARDRAEADVLRFSRMTSDTSAKHAQREPRVGGRRTWPA